LVIWPVKIVPEMTYNVSSVTLNPTHSLTQKYNFAQGLWIKDDYPINMYSLWNPLP